MLLSVSHEQTVWFLCVSISLYQVRPAIMKISSSILLHFAINLVKGFIITSAVLNEARISFFDLQPFFFSEMHEVYKCFRGLSNLNLLRHQL